MQKKMSFGIGLALLLGVGLLCAGNALAQGGHEGGLGIVKIHINLASAVNLAKAKGANEKIAEAIVEYRETKGPFKKIEDLLKVPGVTPEIYKEMGPQVGAEGDLYLIPREGEELEEEDVPVMAPSKC